MKAHLRVRRRRRRSRSSADACRAFAFPVSRLSASIVSSIVVPFGADLVRAVEPVEAAVNGDQAPERLDGEARPTCSSRSSSSAIGATARLVHLLSWSSHLLSRNLRRTVAESDATPMPSRRPLLPPRSSRSRAVTGRAARRRAGGPRAFLRPRRARWLLSRLPPARRPAANPHATTCTRAAASASLAPVSRDHAPAHASASRIDGRAAASTSGHSRRAMNSTSRGLNASPRRYSLTDDVRPHVRRPEDQHRPEQRCGHRSCARPRLVGDADHGCGEERPVDGRAEADVSVKDGWQVGRCTWSRRAGRRLRGRAVVQIDRQCDGCGVVFSDCPRRREWSSPSARAASRRRSRRRAR